MPAPQTGDPSQGLLKISDLFHSPGNPSNDELRLKGEYVIEETPTEGDINCSWLLSRESTGFLVQGNVDAVLKLDCMRCLFAYTVPVSLEIEEHYVFTRFIEDLGREHELQADDFYETVDEAGLLDLKDLVRQFLLLEAEEHSLCGRPDCEISQDARTPL